MRIIVSSIQFLPYEKDMENRDEAPNSFPVAKSHHKLNSRIIDIDWEKMHQQHNNPTAEERRSFRPPLKLQNPRSGELIWGSGGPGGIRTLDTRKGILP